MQLYIPKPFLQTESKRFNDFDALWNYEMLFLLPTVYQTTHVFGIENTVFECYIILNSATL